jgi:hypothetical protein
MMKEKKKNKRKRWGLALADEETRTRVAKAGGNSFHKSRGLGATPEPLRSHIAKLGGNRVLALYGVQWYAVIAKGPKSNRRRSFFAIKFKHFFLKTKNKNNKRERI